VISAIFASSSSSRWPSDEIRRLFTRAVRRPAS
jgi:hypothetical protein